MNDPLKTCIPCGRLISIPPFGLGECSIHEAEHKQKDYCIDWKPLMREMAYCAPLCKMNGRTLRERPEGTVGNAPESKRLSDWPPGSALKTELDTDDAVPGAPLYFVVGWGEVVKLDPKTRSRTTCDLPGITRMCAAVV